MKQSVRRLTVGDEALLGQLAREDADFDLGERGAPLTPLSSAEARAYLADPGVLHWIAEQDGVVVGTLYCCVVRKRAGPDARELLLYEIGVRARERRRGVGRALVEEMNRWMTAQGVREVWVVADNPGAVAFYRAVGFDTVEEGAAVYLAR